MRGKRKKQVTLSYHLLFFRASCRIRTNDPEITNHVLWPTELKRRVGKLAISRRYNQLPLLRSSPGGFEGSWPYRTYPFSFCGCKGRHYFEICNSLRRFFICFLDSLFYPSSRLLIQILWRGGTDSFRHYDGQIFLLLKSIRPICVTLSSDSC